MFNKATKKKHGGRYVQGTIVRKSIGYSMLTPCVIFMIIVQAIPFFYGVYVSFTDKTLFGAASKGTPNFIGVTNYVNVLANTNKASDFYQVFGFTLVYSVVIIVCAYLLGLYFAILLNRPMKYRNLFRSLAFLPWFVNPMVMATSWSQMFDPTVDGILNKLFMALKLIEEPLLWKGDSFWAKVCIIILGVWKAYPMMTVMLLSALQGIDKSIYEPATIAGASEIQKFRYITFPLIMPMSITVCALQFIWMFGTNSYDNIMTVTAGGPGRATYVLTIEVFNQAFKRGKMGFAASISLMMLLFLGVCALLFVTVKKISARVAEKKEERSFESKFLEEGGTEA